MITKHNDLLGTLVHDVAHLLRHNIDGRLKKHNLTRAKWLALGVIRNKPMLTQSELAAELELGNAVVGRLVDRLEERKFVSRELDPWDRRAYRLKLTQKANNLLAKLDDLAVEIRRDVLAGIPPKEISLLNTALNKMKSNLKQKSELITMGCFGLVIKSTVPLKILTFAELTMSL